MPAPKSPNVTTKSKSPTRSENASVLKELGSIFLGSMGLFCLLAHVPLKIGAFMDR